MDKVAQIDKLSVAFKSGKGQLSALDAVGFSLHAGETLALLGESGCGKSLTSQAIMRLLPDNARYSSASTIFLGDADILDLSEKKMRQVRGKRMAMIFQEPMTALNPVLTIGQQLSEVLVRSGCSKKDLRARMIALLKEVEMPQPTLRLTHYPHQLSGGQKQRVVIAIALACNPDILIADEPTTALDVTVQAQILKLLKRLQQQHQMSMLLITHDLSVVKAVADRVCVMYAGQVVEQASVADFFTQVQHPYSQLLLNALPSVDKRGIALPSIEGNVPSLEKMPAGCRFHLRCPYAFTPCSHQEPAMLEINNTSVRCHLYPTTTQLPKIANENACFAPEKKQSDMLLQVTDLSVIFKGKSSIFGKDLQPIKAVDGISFALNSGQTLALVGESGCGKTTTGRAIMRLLPVHKGRIFFQGQAIDSLYGAGLRAFRKQVQIIFQDPFSSMNPRMCVSDIIREGMAAQRVSKNQQQKRLAVLLDQVNLPKSSLSKYPHQFSGGQRQRIGIARALACQPKLLICDEPTSALDVSVQAQILNLLKNLQIELNIAYLFITHDMAVVSYMADAVAVMREGKIVEQGEVMDILHRPQTMYTKNLLASVL